jgi:hypothetical protein
MRRRRFGDASEQGLARKGREMTGGEVGLSSDACLAGTRLWKGKGREAKGKERVEIFREKPRCMSLKVGVS